MSIAERPSARASSRRGEPTPWRNRIVGQADVPPATLVAHPENWRRHPAQQRRVLQAALRDVGWVQRVLVNRHTGHILDGHARVEEALARGEPAVPVTYVELSPDEERAVLASFDVIGSLAVPDPEALDALLAGLGPMDAELRALLDGLAESLTAASRAPLDPDAVPDPPDPASTYVRPGQLWRLGGHRVLCGDALDPGAVARLLAGDRPALLVTDPPYGVELDLGRRHARDGAGRGASRGSGHRRVSLAGDDRADWAAAYGLAPSLRVGYVWYPAVHVGAVVAGLERAGFELVSEIIWKKSRWVVGPRWYHWAHEGCLVVRRPGSRLRFLGGRDQGTVWEAPSPKVGGPGADPKADHPSQKPVVLFERPIRNHLPVGGLAYDPFAGSGTAIIAAEVSRRRCLAMEIEPAFAQVAIERWQGVTGRSAELVDEVR
jgi:DNA modification methylase